MTGGDLTHDVEEAHGQLVLGGDLLDAAHDFDGQIILHAEEDNLDARGSLHHLRALVTVLTQQGLDARAWQGWTYAWDATPGSYVVASRATDAAGQTQPDEPPWNLKGYANNAVERIPVTVRG